MRESAMEFYFWTKKNSKTEITINMQSGILLQSHHWDLQTESSSSPK